MITNRQLDDIARAVDEAMSDARGADPASGWVHVEWLRLKADLLGRLAAAERGADSTLARRVELVRDHAERTADHLTGIVEACAADRHPAPMPARPPAIPARPELSLHTTAGCCDNGAAHASAGSPAEHWQQACRDAALG